MVAQSEHNLNLLSDGVSKKVYLLMLKESRLCRSLISDFFPLKQTAAADLWTNGKPLDTDITEN